MKFKAGDRVKILENLLKNMSENDYKRLARLKSLDTYPYFVLSEVKGNLFPNIIRYNQENKYDNMSFSDDELSLETPDIIEDDILL